MRLQNRPAQRDEQSRSLADWLIGEWLSEVHQTKLEPMRFRCRFEPSGQFVVTGFPDEAQTREVYRLNGEYEIHENTFTSRAINGRRPVRLMRERDQLLFVIDPTIELRLTRLSPLALKAK